jgi:SAM-dependent methyltransferase
MFSSSGVGVKALADRIVGHYERHALAWDADRRRLGWTDRPWLDRFARALPAGGSVLDLGCGGGVPVADLMAGLGFRVTGVDASPTLIALCRERMPQQEWMVADMRGLSLGRRFDGVLAWDSFFHLTPDDQRAMFAVFGQHAAPGGHLMFDAGPAAGEAIGEYRGDPLYHASLSGEDYAALLTGAEFTIIEHRVEDPACGGRTAWLARRKAE